MDEPLYRISQVADAAEVPVNTIRAWFQRGYLRLLDTDKRAEGAGLPHYISMRGALYIGTVAALVAHGVPPKVAGHEALHWLHTGAGCHPGMKPGSQRDPGALFCDGLTVLCIYADSPSRVKNIPFSGGNAFDLFLGHNGRTVGVTAVLLNYVDRKIRLALAPTTNDRADRSVGEGDK
ncbi:hypothetical protein LCGC14_0187810 [marine sediment metagenome]|uniref:HTH merR-type domain-containing protein n=1 Tax=marine sediment metagenome TaxID=412755 RepID=A0A0F9URY6_9ZZZZ